MMWTLGDIIQYWKNNNQLKCNLLLTEPLGLLAGLGKCVEGLQLEFLNFDNDTLGNLTAYPLYKADNTAFIWNLFA